MFAVNTDCKILTSRLGVGGIYVKEKGGALQLQNLTFRNFKD